MIPVPTINTTISKEEVSLSLEAALEGMVLLKNENDASDAMEKQVLDELNEMFGLDEVKKYVHSLKDHYRIQKLRA